MSELTTDPQPPPLSYAARVENARPGVLTAVGVASILVACFTAFDSDSTGMAIEAIDVMTTIPYASSPLSHNSVLCVSLVLFDVVASAGLAIFLMVAGILILRDSPSGRRFLLIYACAKVPVAFIGATAIEWMYWQIVSSSSSRASSIPSHDLVFVVWGFKRVLFGCIYPVALLIEMNTRRMRGYYHIPPRDSPPEHSTTSA